MRIRHIYPSASCRAEVTEPTGFLIGSATNWFSLSSERQSRYEGWFVDDPRTTPHSFIKLLERVTYVKGEDNEVEVEPIGLTLTGDHAFWEYGDGARIGFYALPDAPALRLQSARPATLALTLDIRGIYQAPDLGRRYQVHQVPGGIFVQYQDELLGQTVYLALKTDGDFCLDEWWEAVTYPWDAARNSDPGTKHVYNLGVCNATWIGIGAGTTAEAAQQNCALAVREQIPIIGIGIAHAPDNLTEEVRAARYAAAETLEVLMHEDGTYAGLPWFHQVWSRDELIAALGMPKGEQLEVIKRYLKLPLTGGELPTFTGSGTTCADGVGWLALLIREYGVRELSATQQKKLTTFLKSAVTGLRKAHYSDDQLILSGHNATWMDTIGREGARIEIQAMFGLMLELLADITGDKECHEEREAHLKRVRAAFYKQGVLWDGADDPTIRPNCFLTYLIQPDMLKAAEWERVFGTALGVLRTSWGGLASVDPKNKAYQAESTGETNESYHQGDSWFFVNNLAGVTLSRFGMRQFRPVVEELLKSSTEEILWKHTAGHAGEIASAKSGTSWGCGVQAFAAGAYLMLTEELGF